MPTFLQRFNLLYLLNEQKIYELVIKTKFVHGLCLWIYILRMNNVIYLDKLRCFLWFVKQEMKVANIAEKCVTCWLSKFFSAMFATFITRLTNQRKISFSFLYIRHQL